LLVNILNLNYAIRVSSKYDTFNSLFLYRRRFLLFLFLFWLFFHWSFKYKCSCNLPSAWAFRVFC